MIDAQHLVTLADRFCAATDRGVGTLSTQLLGRGSRLQEIRRGADITTRRYRDALVWFSANWPADLGWPDDIPRPDHAPAPRCDDEDDAAASASRPVPSETIAAQEALS